MLPLVLRRLSLKSRIALAMALVFVAFSSTLAVLGLRHFESEFRNSLYSQQFELASSLAANVDDKLRTSQNALIAASSMIPRDVLKDADKAQRFLDGRSALHTIFDNGLFLISPEGKIIAESPFQSMDRRGRDLSFREFVQVTKATKKPYISKPFASTFGAGQPGVVMTVPLLDEQGQLIGIFEGGLKLLGKNMLADLSKVKIGQTGYIYITDQERLMITHADPSRIMKPAAQPGQNPLYDQAIAGFEGSGRTTTSLGVAMYSSFRRLPTTDWILGANYPVAEAEAPLRKAQTYFIAALSLGTLLLLAIVWLLARHLMAPLAVLTRHVRELPAKTGPARRLELAGHGEVGELANAFNDMVRELDRQQQSLRESEARFRSLTELSSDWYWEQDEHLRFTLMSSGLTKTRVASFAGKTRWELPLEGISEAQWQAHRRALERHEPFQNFTYQISAESGEPRIFSISGVPVFDEQGAFRGYRGVGSDITERTQAEKRVEFLAYHDALTGLPNRLLMQDRCEQAIAQAGRTGTKVALLFLDLDNFKTINDSLGHEAGDALLKEVARRLQTCVRDTDTISRQGGDEFLIALRDLPDVDTAANIVAKLIERIQEPLHLDSQEVSTSVSVGIALFPEDGHDFETLRRKADLAMYRAKEAGRNTCRFFDETMNVEAAEHLLLRNGLYHALERGELTLHYQPQVDLGTRAIVGVEALLRWRHPELGMVSPARFIPVAEESGLIVPIGEWVLHEACRQSVAWQQAGLPALVVAVNLSALQFKRGDVEQAVQRALDASGLAPQLLELELTESILIQNVEGVLASVKRLKQIGVQIAIDDFGTGYSSLSYLKRLDIDKLKIDQSFVRDLAVDPDDAAIVKAIIQLAHSLNLRTVAEGVETEQIREELSAFQCDEAQGYLFSRPLEAAALARWLAP
jgi:diguanylate cyclase (GGDEF)-like protein/PAS domain S-box-containing protein